MNTSVNRQPAHIQVIRAFVSAFGNLALIALGRVAANSRFAMGVEWRRCLLASVSAWNIVVMTRIRAATAVGSGEKAGHFDGQLAPLTTSISGLAAESRPRISVPKA